MSEGEDAHTTRGLLSEDWVGDQKVPEDSGLMTSKEPTPERRVRDSRGYEERSDRD